MCYLHSPARMLLAHVIVNPNALVERLQALPAGMRMTACARHMVTTLRPLDGSFATRAFLDFVRANVLVERAVDTELAVVAGDALVILDVAVWTDAYQTRRAAVDAILCTWPVHLLAVRRRTEPEFIRL